MFVTNNLKLAASTIAAIYRERWQIELFFKALKQSEDQDLRGNQRERRTDANLDRTDRPDRQVPATASTFGWSLSNLVALLRQQLFVYRDLFTWLNDPFQAPPVLDSAVEQLVLSW